MRGWGRRAEGERNSYTGSRLDVEPDAGCQRVQYHNLEIVT